VLRRHRDGIAACCKPENKVSRNNKIPVFQRREKKALPPRRRTTEIDMAPDLEREAPDPLFQQDRTKVQDQSQAEAA
jgi:hypothetical protein